MRTARKQRKEPERDPALEIEELRTQLDEAQETLRAIRAGEVDAVITSTREGDRVFTLRGAETPYRVIVENISEGAATLLPDGMILYANTAFSNLLKVPLERIIGTRFEDYVWDTDRALLPGLFEKSLNEIVRREIRLKTASSWLPVYISLRHLPLDEEKPGLSMVVTDISERKRAEEELRRAHDELDVRVHQRTRELKEANASLHSEIAERKRAEEALKRVVKDLARSNSELQQFAYVASHDLQEPLRTVASYLELLAMRYKGKLDEKADKYIFYAVDGASRMSTLINDLLAYSRVGSRGKPFSSVPLSAVLHKVLASLKSVIRENNAAITYDELPVVTGDETQLTQLLQNMIVNAIKFRRKDASPVVHLSAKREKNEWVIGIHDNGIGIDPAFKERVFAIFQRLHTREEYAGTGMGLAIARRIVERHGGRIWVESAPGEGATFFFTLPAQ
jgi:PAS domain S-box-containing protein